MVWIVSTSRRVHIVFWQAEEVLSHQSVRGENVAPPAGRGTCPYWPGVAAVTPGLSLRARAPGATATVVQTRPRATKDRPTGPRHRVCGHTHESERQRHDAALLRGNYVCRAVYRSERVWVFFYRGPASVQAVVEVIGRVDGSVVEVADRGTDRRAKARGGVKKNCENCARFMNYSAHLEGGWERKKEHPLGGEWAPV